MLPISLTKNHSSRRFYVANSPSIVERIKSAWNTFRDRDPEANYIYNLGESNSIPVHRSTLSTGTEMSIVSSVYNRVALDISMIDLRHVRTDENGNYVETIDSGLNKCLNLSANLDQSAHAFMLDVIMSMFDEGYVAVVPVDTSVNSDNTGSYEILSMRTGKILEWFPRNVRVEVYNDLTGKKEEVILQKSKIGIIENPLYAVMNEPNSTLKRLINKLNLLDAIDEQSGSGKLDLIIQLPYVIKSDARRKLAEERLAALEAQLKDSKHGVAYTDGTEKVVQLNRPAENKLLDQIEYLTRMLYSQLGMSESIFDGTADETALLNYYNRTIFPIISAIAEEFKRKFLTPTAVTQMQSISHFRNPFSLVTAADLAELADKFTRNEILTGNEFRAVLGFIPSKDPSANELRNKNLNVPAKDATKPVETDVPIPEGDNQNGSKS